MNANNLVIIDQTLNEINDSSIGTIRDYSLNLFGQPNSKNYGFSVIEKNSLEYKEAIKKQEIVYLYDLSNKAINNNWGGYIFGVVTFAILAVISAIIYYNNDPYRILENYLKSQSWEQADLETKKVLLELANKTDGSFLTEDDIKKFNCSDIKRIDELWTNNTKNKFGFSVQGKIIDETINDLSLNQQTPYTSINNTDQPKVMGYFGNKVGWLVNSKSGSTYSSLAYNLDASPKYLRGIWRQPSSGLYYNNNYIYNLDAPVGHLPSWYFIKKCIAPDYHCENEDVNQKVIVRGNFLSMLQKVKQCNLY
ncbi:MAG: GUN4 domain-containing protein [Nostoc sp.]|uniref:GUN4 domain-containing protein n=1 Tax=Nostoc sp. TaxID=1180 RepID=UPI002FF9603D